MSGKKTSLRVLERIPPTLKVEEQDWNPEAFARKINIRLMTQEEKMREASKPLYLKRYE